MTSPPKAVNFIPLAEINTPVGHLKRDLKRHGVAFVVEQDDLDSYEIAYLTLPDDHHYAVMHYKGAPADKVSLLVSTELFHAAANQTIIQSVSQDLHIPMSSFNWRSRGGETLGTVPLKATAAV